VDPSFIEELKRRRVFRALVGWGIVAFAVLQKSSSRSCGYRDAAGLRQSQFYAGLRKDPRFDALLAKDGVSR
jgi:hypothetical protein